MEQRIYARQIIKESVSKRVVDDQQVERHFSQLEIRELYKFDPEMLRTNEPRQLPDLVVPKDHLLTELINRERKWFVNFSNVDCLLGICKFAFKILVFFTL